MKLFNLFSCLLFASTLQWTSVKAASIKDEIKIPSLINIEGEDSYKMMASRPKEVYDDNDEVVGDIDTYIPLENCRYKISDEKVYCDFEDERSYLITFDVKVRDSCKITDKTTFEKADVYFINDHKKLIKDEFVIYYEKTGKKITFFKLTGDRFVFLTNDDCNFTLDITKARMTNI